MSCAELSLTDAIDELIRRLHGLLDLVGCAPPDLVLLLERLARAAESGSGDMSDLSPGQIEMLSALVAIGVAHHARRAAAAGAGDQFADQFAAAIPKGTS